VQLTESEFLSQPVSALRHLLLSFGLSDEGALEKRELRARLLDSGRVTLLLQEEGGQDVFSVPELRAMPLSSLREICERKGLALLGCLDKSEVVERMASSDLIRIVYTPTPSSSFNESVSYSDEKYDCKCDKPFPGEAKSSSSLASIHYPLRITRSEINCLELDDLHELWFKLVGSNYVEIGKENFLDERDPFKKAKLIELLEETRKIVIEENISEEKYDSKNIENEKEEKQFASCEEDLDDRFMLSRELLADMSIKELKSIMQANNLSDEGCLYRSDIISKLESCAKLRIVD
jgi:hypothetical protein